MMDRILALRGRIDKPIFLAFKHSRAYLAVHFGRSLFEPGIAETTSLESVQEMAAQFALAEGIVNELDLNTRIWTKGVDASWLRPQPCGATQRYRTGPGIAEATAQLQLFCTQTMSDLMVSEPGTLAPLAAASAAL